MIGTSRSFEHNSYAKNRAHLQPVVKSAKPMSEMSQALIVGFFIGFLGALAYLVGPYVRSMFS